MEKQKIYTATIELNKLSSKIEQLSSKKKSLATPPQGDTVTEKAIRKYEEKKAELLEKIKKATKKANEEISALVKTLSVFEAYFVVSACCQSPEGSDNALRQRFNRRRNTLKKTLVLTFPDYDCIVVKRNNRASLEPKLVGDENVREALNLLATIDRLQKLGVEIETPKVETLTASIKAETPVVYSGVTPVNDGIDTVKDMKSELTDCFEIVPEGPSNTEETEEMEKQA